ncbi:MAG: GIY-YIG nuclease family protein [Candidatus Berkelbacteria bacterium]|nr:GIY-YIG nuclease family protein [Candidatus Berkelbacteria bacterium]
MSRSDTNKTKRWKWYVYILECRNDTYYTGLTWDPNIRLEQHQSQFGSKYTSRYGVKKLVYLEEYDNLETARIREKQIKDWNRNKKEKLIKGEWGKEW